VFNVPFGYNFLSALLCYYCEQQEGGKVKTPKFAISVFSMKLNFEVNFKFTIRVNMQNK